MNYKVIPFAASVGSTDAASAAAGKVEQMIKQQATEGWEFISCGNVDTVIAGSNGCFGIGATQAQNTSVMVLVFKK